eukprot:6200742-Pleurochrysis_carterae.AAC.1
MVEALACRLHSRGQTAQKLDPAVRRGCDPRHDLHDLYLALLRPTGYVLGTTARINRVVYSQMRARSMPETVLAILEHIWGTVT